VNTLSGAGPVTCWQLPQVTLPSQSWPRSLVLFSPLHGASVSASADPGWPVSHTLAAPEKSKNASQSPASAPALSHCASYMTRGASFGSVVSLSPVRSAGTQMNEQAPVGEPWTDELPPRQSVALSAGTST
jgi:hypothetical protein